MARHTLIDHYVDTMRNRIRWRRDLDDLVSEIEDHLYSSVETLLATGVDADAAQRTTLDRFGDPEVLAVAYASTPSGGIAMPTKGTKRIGIIAAVGAALWVLAIVTYFVLVVVWPDDWQGWYAAFTYCILSASILTLVTMIGIGSRMGGLGVGGWTAVVITGIGVLATLVAWALFLWMTILGMGMLIFGLTMLRRDGMPTVGTLLASTGLLVGFIVFLAASALEVGPVDEWGDYPVAGVLGVTVGLGIVAAGLVGWSRWLRNEPIPEVHDHAVPA